MTIRIDELVEREPLGRVQYLTLALVSLAVIVDGFDIQAIAFAGPALLAEWGLSKAELGTAVAAALVGMAVGAPLGGMIGDRIGRRAAIILSVFFFSAMTLAAASAQSMQQLTMLRLAGGLGFGAMLPNAAALIAEWTPSRARSHAISLMIIGIPLGGMLAAALSSWLIADHGWRACFVAGGALGLIAALLLLLLLPESLRFLAARKERRARLAALLVRAFPAAAIDPGADFCIDEPPSKAGLAGLFAPGHRRVTTGLVLAFFANLAVSYAFFNWVPTMLVSMGLPMEAAIRGAFHYNLWGLAGALLGATVIALLGSRAGLLLIVGTAVAVSGAMGVWILTGAIDETGVIVGLALAGTCISGLQAALYALAATAYPTNCRSSGVGFAGGAGRLGAIASAFGGAAVLALPDGAGLFFAMVTGLLLLAGAAILIVDRHSAPVARRT